MFKLQKLELEVTLHITPVKLQLLFVHCFFVG